MAEGAFIDSLKRNNKQIRENRGKYWNPSKLRIEDIYELLQTKETINEK